MMQIRLHFVVWKDVPHGSGVEQDIFNEMERFVPRKLWSDSTVPNTLVCNFKTRAACEAAIQEVACELNNIGRYYTETIVLVREEEWPLKLTS